MLTSTVCLCCVRFNFFASKPRHRLGRTSPKWCALSWVGHKTSGATCTMCGSTLIRTVTCISVWTHAYQRCNWTRWKQWWRSQYMHIHACPHCSTPHQREWPFTHSLTHSLAPKANHLGELKQVSRLDALSVVQPSGWTTLRASNQVQQSLYWRDCKTIRN